MSTEVCAEIVNTAKINNDVELVEMIIKSMRPILAQNLISLIKCQYIDVQFDYYRFDKRGQVNEWDGLMKINFNTDKPLATDKMINMIIAVARADDVHMPDASTLTLWWD
jgi:hypothetical protein